MKKLLSAGNLKSFLLVGSILLIAMGCVSKTKHQELINSYTALAEQKSNVEKSCDENTEQLTGQIAALEEKSAGCEKQNKKLTRETEQLAQAKADEARNMQEMVSVLEQKLAGEVARISQLENALRIEMVDKLMFKSGSASVTRAGSKILAKIAPTLIAAVDKDIIIIGHTDDLPPSTNLKRKFPSNWELSAARAAAIVHILTWNYKIDPARMTIQGEAHYHPLASFDPKDKTARATNRAVEIILKSKEK